MKKLILIILVVSIFLTSGCYYVESPETQLKKEFTSTLKEIEQSAPEILNEMTCGSGSSYDSSKNENCYDLNVQSLVDKEEKEIGAVFDDSRITKVCFIIRQRTVRGDFDVYNECLESSEGELIYQYDDLSDGILMPKVVVSFNR
jgi:hypothetical protein